ncbi:hypothetical protein F5B17DRAFT_425998 [Nemania serpens]|nr:hypothetical protein F5B17DRAFT_425998 [Nemania serpens]
MTFDEFVAATEGLGGHDTWYHFEGRIPATTLQCIQWLRRSNPNARVSIEVEKPGREGLEELVAEADVVFFSRSWAESKLYMTAEECLRAQSAKARRGTVGAGDTFIAGILFGFLHHEHSWDNWAKLSFAVQVATCKVQQEGFNDLGSKAPRRMVVASGLEVDT